METRIFVFFICRNFLDGTSLFFTEQKVKKVLKGEHINVKDDEVDSCR